MTTTTTLIGMQQASRSDYLVTGDNDLLALKQHAGARDSRAAGFYDALLRERAR